MTTGKKIAVAEWMGYRLVKSTNNVGFPYSVIPPNGNPHEGGWATISGAWSHDIPPITLDWMHECEKNLFVMDNLFLSSPQPSDIYAYHLEVGVLGRQLWSNGVSILQWGDVQKLVHATAEQRLDALLKTIGKL